MWRIVIVWACFSTMALAQQQTPAEQALGNKIFVEINAGLQCATSLITAQHALAVAQARIKELEEKYEKKDEKK